MIYSSLKGNGVDDMQEPNRNYILAIRRAHNNYLPLDLSILNLPNLNTLEAIDSFTKNISKEELVNIIITNDIAQEDELFEDFTIIFKEKGKIRELSEGTCFMDDANFLNPYAIIDFIYNNYHNKILINKIYNYLNTKTASDQASEIKFILNNLSRFAEKGDKAVKIVLNKLYDVEYEIIRQLGMYIKKTIIPSLEEQDTIKLKKDTQDKKIA